MRYFENFLFQNVSQNESHIKKIAKWIDPKNPLTISEMVRRLGMSRWYVRSILRKILDVYQVKKRKVQELT